MDGLAHCLGALENAGIGQRAVACHEAADHQRAPYAIRNGAGRCAGKERLLQWRERRSHRRTMPLKMTDRIRRIDKESCGAGVNLRCPTGVLWVGHKNAPYPFWRWRLAAAIGWATIKRRNGSIVSCWENPLRRVALGSPGVTTSRALSAMGTRLAHGGGSCLARRVPTVRRPRVRSSTDDRKYASHYLALLL